MLDGLEMLDGGKLEERRRDEKRREEGGEECVGTIVGR